MSLRNKSILHFDVGKSDVIFRNESFYENIRVGIARNYQGQQNTQKERISFDAFTIVLTIFRDFK